MCRSSRVSSTSAALRSSVRVSSYRIRLAAPLTPDASLAALTRDSIRGNLPALRSFFGVPAGIPPFTPSDNFRANEKSYAAYAQLKYGFDLGSMVVDGLVGLRAVKTKTRINGFSRVEATGGAVTFPAVTADNEYTDYLPNVSTRLAFTDKLQLRLAYTQTRTRPGFFDLRPNTSLGQPVVLAPGDACLVNPTIPDCAKGFGIQANGTYIDSKEDLNPGSRRFQGVSKYAYNVVGLYERSAFSARLAYNYRSKFVTAYTTEALDPLVHPIVEKGRGQLDFSTSVTPVPNITLAFDIVNLLGNPLRRYRPYDTGDSYTRQILYIERAYSLGIRFRF